MSENNVKMNSSGISIINALIKKWFLILLITVLCALVGLGYSAMFVRPTYTATRSVILRLSVGDLKASTVTTNVTLSKIYLPDVMEFVSSPAVVNKANEVYEGEGNIRTGAIGVSYGNKDIDSLIFSVSYTDYDVDMAEEKLNTLLESIVLVDQEKGVIEAEDFSLKPTQRNCDFSMNNSFATYIVLGAIAGLLIGVVIVVIMYVTDNTVVDKEEFEMLTGVDILSCIRKNKK